MWGETLVMDSRHHGRREREEQGDQEESSFRTTKRFQAMEATPPTTPTTTTTTPFVRKRRIEELRTGVGARYPYDEGSYTSITATKDGWGLPSISVLDPDFESSGVAMTGGGMPPLAKKSGVDWESGNADSQQQMEEDDSGHFNNGGDINGVGEAGTGRCARVENEEDLLFMNNNPYSKCNFLLRSLTLDRLGRTQRDY